MKINIPEDLYFQMSHIANDMEISFDDYLRVLLSNQELSINQMNNADSKEVFQFALCLNNTVEELLDNQLDISLSDEGIQEDKQMYKVLHHVFSNLYKNPILMNQCFQIFYDKMNYDRWDY